jgi:hypothetical protein
VTLHALTCDQLEDMLGYMHDVVYDNHYLGLSPEQAVQLGIAPLPVSSVNLGKRKASEAEPWKRFLATWLGPHPDYQFLHL